MFQQFVSVRLCIGSDEWKLLSRDVPMSVEWTKERARKPSGRRALLLINQGLRRYAATRAPSGSAAFAWATIALKVSASCMARSARTLRSSSTPASLSPCMNTP